MCIRQCCLVERVHCAWLRINNVLVSKRCFPEALHRLRLLYWVLLSDLLVLRNGWHRLVSECIVQSLPQIFNYFIRRIIDVLKSSVKVPFGCKKFCVETQDLGNVTYDGKHLSSARICPLSNQYQLYHFLYVFCRDSGSRQPLVYQRSDVP